MLGPVSASFRPDACARVTAAAQREAANTMGFVLNV